MSKTELVGPFTGDQKPVRVGVYKRQEYETFHYSYWSGNCWYYSAPDPATAVRYKQLGAGSNMQNLLWYGLEQQCQS